MDTNIITGVMVFLKGLFPAFIGSVLAVWYKKDDIQFKELKASHKAFICLVIFCAILVGVSLGHMLGGSIIHYFSIPETSYYADLIKFFIGLSSLKIIDSSMKNIDVVLEIINNSIIERLKRFLGKT